MCEVQIGLLEREEGIMSLAEFMALQEWRLRRALASAAPLVQRAPQPHQRRAAAVRALRVQSRGRYTHDEHPHGTMARYTHGKCRCAPCRECHRAYVADYRRLGR